MDSSDISPSAVQNREEADAKDSGSAETLKVGKNGASKETGHSILNSVNKSAFQIKKPPHRRTSPLNWFPRKKTDSYLKRKIKLLQEVGGMNSSLDETLGDSNPHYSRVEREKIAAREAARKAMEARKAAMVEASWCRILRAARIPSKEAESQLSKAEKNVAEAFKEAAAKGVIMHDRPDCPRQPCDVETSSITEGRSTHTVAASFETAFEVDKEVAAAVKTAFIRLTNCPDSSNKEDFHELLWKISQNPDISETNQEISELPSESEPDTGSEYQSLLNAAGFSSSSSDRVNREMGLSGCKNGQLAVNNNSKSSKLSTGLIDMMLDRLKSLQEEELASLATIVATCGLNAVLEEEINKQHDSGTTNCTVGAAPPFGSGSTRHFNMSLMDTRMKKKQPVTELPSLDKFLVKHVSRLEKEMQEAKNARKNYQAEGNGKTMETSDEQHISESGLVNPIVGTSSEVVTDLGSSLVKHTLRFEKEIEEAKKSQGAFEESERFRDVQHSKQDVNNQSFKQSADLINLVENIDGKQVEKENIDFNKPSRVKVTVQTGGMTTRLPPKKHMSRIERAKLETMEAFSDCNEHNSLDKILVKSMHRLEKLKMQALASGKDYVISRDQKKQQGTEITASESLDKVLVKHLSRLEKEKMAVHAKEDVKVNKDKQLDSIDGESLDKVLVKHVSRLEKEKMAVHAKEDVVKVNKGKQQLVTADGESLDMVLVKHVSRLEKEKMEVRAKEDAAKVNKDKQPVTTDSESLDKILVKHQSELEKAKWAALSQMSAHDVKHSEIRQEARERELQEAWGGLSLGNSIRPHLSRLERDKAAWKRAEEKERRRELELV